MNYSTAIMPKENISRIKPLSMFNVNRQSSKTFVIMITVTKPLSSLLLLLPGYFFTNKYDRIIKFLDDMQFDVSSTVNLSSPIIKLGSYAIGIVVVFPEHYLNTHLIFFEHLSARVAAPVSFQEFLSEPAIKTLIIFSLEVRAALPNTIHCPKYAVRRN